MEYSKFIKYNIIGGVLWISVFSLAGFFFGNIPFIKENFHYAIFAIIFLSLVPVVYEFIQNKRHPDVPGVKTKTLEKIVNE
ncbi:membrane-associated protein [sediment metagenome]|uniref:Membrane-associated protein n=1 Tax=sediment metagenome TaxID=749907 RepID=D9PKS8_9ZZZZ